MNDRHPSGNSFPADPASDFSYAAYDTTGYAQSPYGTYENGGYTAHGYAAEATPSTGYDGYSTGASYGDGDPLFGTLPGSQDHTGGYGAVAYGTGTYDTGAYATGAYDHSGYDHSGFGQDTYGTGGYDTGNYDTSGYDTGGYAGAWTADGYGYGYSAGIPAQAGPTQDEYGYPAPAEATPQWDSGAYATPQWDSGAYPAYEAAAYESSAYESTAYETNAYDTGAYETGVYEAGFADGAGSTEDIAPTDDAAFGEDAEYAEDPRDEQPEAEPEPVAVIPSVPHSRGRRRSPRPKRSALLTVAAPSVAVLGVAGIAAASVGGITTPDETEGTTQAAPDPASVQTTEANSKLDTQLAGLSADADDFADRASRTQERIDLKKRQAAEKERKAEEAARKEAMRPKFVLPVKGYGISAYYGQAGVNWMSVHTGLDFPVSYGTPVKSATDGTITTQWNGSYGNVAIVTAADGTETWYCHLSSTKIRSGPVQAGDVIAYSGNSGNSTGPHLHFEVRPGGGSAIDPLPWFRSHGLEPG